MASSDKPSLISDDINANIKALWPGKDIEIEYCTDDYETYYADLLELCGESYHPIYCDAYGAKGIERATEKMHRMIKQALAKKLAAKADSEGDKDEQ